MNSPYRPTASFDSVERGSLQADGRPQRVMPLTRDYEVAYLTPFGRVDFKTIAAPATPVFEDAFAALGRGTLIATVDGDVAVEDIVPGVGVQTAFGGVQKLLWVGSITVVPQRSGAGRKPHMLRVPAGSFGEERPKQDLILGPRARLLYQNSACVAITGAARAFAPACGFVDGMSVVQLTQTTPLTFYHLGFRGQQTIFANGLEVETYHPGPDLAQSLDPQMLAQFLALFPHIDGLRDFGTLQTSRLTSFELEQLRG